MINLNEFEEIENIKVGEPLDFDVFNDGGKLLLSHGFVVESDEQLHNLLERGSKNGVMLRRAIVAVNETRAEIAKQKDKEVREERAKLLSPKTIDALYNSLYRAIAYSDKTPFTSSISKLVHDIQLLCDMDEDSVFGFMIFGNGVNKNESKYSFRHAVQTALVCEIVSKNLGVDIEDRAPIVSAALTMNISMMNMQDKLFNQKAPLVDAQRQIIMEHPKRSVNKLKELGVTDKTWLRAVLGHHEEPDGSGYPNKLNSTDNCFGGNLIHLADVYCAKIDARKHRPETSSNHGLKSIFDMNHADGLQLKFVKTLGIFPPGTVVKLESGEVGVVVKRNTEDTRHPLVKVVQTPSGFARTPMKIRNTAEVSYKIVRAYPSSHLKVKVDNGMLWFTKRKRGINE